MRLLQISNSKRHFKKTPHFLEPTILFRPSLAEEGELEDARWYFIVHTNRTDAFSPHKKENRDHHQVIGRYSVLPYYRETYEDLYNMGSVLCNSPEQHNYLATIEQWYWDLEAYTPKTYFAPWDLPEGKSFVVKGQTNSRKHEWNRRMFAPTRADVSNIVQSLLDDALIRDQGIVVREYVPLVTYERGINDLPFTNEWRAFFWKDILVDAGYYWSTYDGPRMERMPKEAYDLLDKVSEVICSAERATFYVVDIAQSQTGEWIVIELNDGQMSGLSTIPPKRFYAHLAYAVHEEYANLVKYQRKRP